ncbi:ATPase AAA [Thermodesulfomicrobium sp. WS]|uniref:ATP-binding protein n=1 Tax=Thermodesulfomicrobium sp. WS TaxID=3004129 RepID=UPI002490BB08|nr:ATP-binding protein [Thermodesulfomicrobium sp. WS]BDV01669.1 ATPase AAA [Thermodesulfomicrobium sp. WS]
MERKKLPIGIQTFAKIRQENCYYVDKTPFVAHLAENGGYYFLSRPRRFGKSLFLDTLAEAFAANRALFTGLYLENHWDWEKRHPVIRLSFAEGRLERREELDRSIRRQLHEHAQRFGMTLCDLEDIPGSFGELITGAAERLGERTVVLIDEYDKPILDNLTDPDTARAMREGLRNLYSVLKGRDADLRFVFLTGVSKFSKVSLFSGLNNLNDITVDERYATICGYTEDDLDAVFGPEFTAAAKEDRALDRDAVRAWYNGYRWGSEESVYNPFDVLLLLRQREFRAWWFETATPTFLVEWLTRHQFFTPRLERLYADDALLSAFDVEAIAPEALLWQTGYVTITRVHRSEDGVEYELGLPNREVRMALNRALVRGLVPELPHAPSFALTTMLKEGDAHGLGEHMRSLFAGIPADWYRKNPMARYEGYFASVFYSHLAGLGVMTIPERICTPGRLDLVVIAGAVVWIFEFKVIDGDTPTGEALRQIQEKGYAAAYRGKAAVARVVEVGVEFSTAKRQIVGWEVA